MTFKWFVSMVPLVGAVLGGIFYGLYLLVEGCSNDSVFEIPYLAAAC